MTIRARNRAITAGGIVAVIAIVATLLPMVASSEWDPKRDVHLVIRDMAYYVDGKGDPNPTLEFRRGERVRLRVTSEDAGMEHDFVMKNLKVATKLIEGRGTEVVNIRMPKQAGTDTYFCTPHSAKMRGTIVIQ
jgi:heme/copper-type cytochrome/quinol oxidase subunit 2